MVRHSNFESGSIISKHIKYCLLIFHFQPQRSGRTGVHTLRWNIPDVHGNLMSWCTDSRSKRPTHQDTWWKIIWVCLEMTFTPNYSHLMLGKWWKKIIGFRGFPIGAKPISPRESGPLQEALDPSLRPHLKPPETIVFFSGSKWGM